MLWLPCVLNNHIRWAILSLWGSAVSRKPLEPLSCLSYTLQKTLVVA